MKKYILTFITLISLSLDVQAGEISENVRLKELISKEITFKSNGGSLSDAELTEKTDLISKIGIVNASQILEEAIYERSTALKTQQPMVPQVVPDISSLNKQASSLMSQPAPKQSISSPKKEEEKINSETASAPATSTVAEKSEDQPESKAENVAKDSVEKNPVNETKEASIDSPGYSDAEKEKLLKKIEKNGVDKTAGLKRNTPVGREVAASFISKKNVVYDKLPKNGIKRPGAEVERGSINIVRDYIGLNDAYSVDMCIDTALTIILDDKKMELQDIVLTDAKVYFDAKKMNNNLGVLVRQIESVPEGYKRETDLYLFRKSDDKPYLIKLTGLPCPRGKINFPKVLYLKDRDSKEDSIKQNVLPPEDMVVEVTKGYKRVNDDKINVYDLNIDSASSISLVAVEIVSNEKVPGYTFAITNNIGDQAVLIDSVKFLEKSSQLKGEQEGKNVYRYLIYPKINKDYVLTRRHINIFAISDEKKSYQHLQVDLLPKFVEKTERQD